MLYSKNLIKYAKYIINIVCFYTQFFKLDSPPNSLAELYCNGLPAEKTGTVTLETLLSPIFDKIIY